MLRGYTLAESTGSSCLEGSTADLQTNLCCPLARWPIGTLSLDMHTGTQALQLDARPNTTTDKPRQIMGYNTTLKHLTGAGMTQAWLRMVISDAPGHPLGTALWCSDVQDALDATCCMYVDLLSHSSTHSTGSIHGPCQDMGRANCPHQNTLPSTCLHSYSRVRQVS